MTEMEERVARALDPVAFGRHDPSRLPAYYEGMQRDALIMARAAIRAMREPTDEMETAGFVAGNEADDPHEPGNHAVTAKPVWQAMIDAASPKEHSD